MSIPKKLLAPAVISFAYSLSPCAALAQIESPVPLVPERFRWLSPPNNPALQYAWLLGNEQKHGPYILRVQLAAGGRILSHTHPDERISTVLSGTIYVGFGKTVDESKAVAIPRTQFASSLLMSPHHLWVMETPSTKSRVSAQRRHHSSHTKQEDDLKRRSADDPRAVTFSSLHRRDSPLPCRFA
jgi:hypothetical protein